MTRSFIGLPPTHSSTPVQRRQKQQLEQPDQLQLQVNQDRLNDEVAPSNPTASTNRDNSLRRTINGAVNAYDTSVIECLRRTVTWQFPSLGQRQSLRPPSVFRSVEEMAIPASQTLRATVPSAEFESSADTFFLGSRIVGPKPVASTPLHKEKQPQTLSIFRSVEEMAISAFQTTLRATDQSIKGDSRSVAPLLDRRIPGLKSAFRPVARTGKHLANILHSTPQNLIPFPTSTLRPSLPVNSWCRPLPETVSGAEVKRGDMMVANADDSNYDCGFCKKKKKKKKKKTFATFGLLKRHYAKCHRDGKRHICSCGKGFQDAFDLKRHARIHSGRRPFRCTSCDKAFTQRGSLETHRLKVHGVQHEYAFKQRREKIYVCEDCDHSTGQPLDFITHLMDNHPNSPTLRRQHDKRLFQFNGSLESFSEISSIYSDQDRNQNCSHKNTSS